MRYIDPNYLKPNNSKNHIKIGDIYLIDDGYMKVTCLRSFRLNPIVSGIWQK